MVATQAAQCKAILLHTKYYPDFQDRVFWVLDDLSLPIWYELKPEYLKMLVALRSVHESYSRNEARNTQRIVEQILRSNIGYIGSLA